MNKLFLILIMLIGFMIIAHAQEDGLQLKAKSKKELRLEKKAERKKERGLDRQERVMETNNLIESRTWVLEASQLRGYGGQFFNLDPSINFIRVDENTCTIQLGFNGLMGWNGVGGVTLEGEIVSYEITKPKKKGEGSKLNLATQGLGINSKFFVKTSGEYGDVLLTGSFSGKPLAFRGKIMHPSKSKTYRALKNN